MRTLLVRGHLHVKPRASAQASGCGGLSGSSNAMALDLFELSTSSRKLITSIFGGLLHFDPFRFKLDLGGGQLLIGRLKPSFCVGTRTLEAFLLAVEFRPQPINVAFRLLQVIAGLIGRSGRPLQLGGSGWDIGYDRDMAASSRPGGQWRSGQPDGAILDGERWVWAEVAISACEAHEAEECEEQQQGGEHGADRRAAVIHWRCVSRSDVTVLPAAPSPRETLDNGRDGRRRFLFALPNGTLSPRSPKFPRDTP